MISKHYAPLALHPKLENPRADVFQVVILF